MERKLTSREILLTQRSIAEGIAAEESDQFLKRRRHLLAESFGPEISRVQVSSVGANLRIKAQKVLESVFNSSDISQVELSRDQLIACHYYYHLGVSRRERRQNLQDLSITHAIPKKLLLHVISRFDESITNRRTASKVKNHRTTVSRECDIAKTEDPLPQDDLVAARLPSSVRVGGITGDELDYANLASKQKMHAEWLQFLQTHADPQFFQSAKVLCTPSQFPDPEICDVYDKVGIKRSNILAVERSTKASVQKAFRENCERLGIQHTFGELADIAPTLKDSFAIVNYDPIGQFCASYQRIFENILLAKHALIIVNLRVGREDSWIKEALGSMYHQYAKYAPMLDFIRESEGEFNGDASEWERRVEGLYDEWIASHGEQSEEALLKEMRDKFIDHAVVNSFVAKRPEAFQPLNKLLPKGRRISKNLMEIPLLLVRHIEDLEQKILEFIAKFPRLDAQLLGLNDTGRAVMPHRALTGIAYESSISDPKASFLDKIEYDSATGGSKFYTTLAVMETPTSKYKQWAPVAQFMIRIAHDMLLDRQNETQSEFQLRLLRPSRKNRDAEIATKADFVSKRYELAFFKDGKVIEQIRLGRLFSSMRDYGELRRGRYRYDSPWFQANLERRKV